MSARSDHPLFDEALSALDAGDIDALGRLLVRAPDLVHARATSEDDPYEGYFYGATLLHHVAANPIRVDPPANIVAATRLLLSAGADPDAGCGGGPGAIGDGTVLGLVASGARAHELGHTEGLIDVLLEHGATLDPDGGMWGTIYHAVEHRGQRDVARMLHERGVNVDLPMAAALGRLDLVRGFFDAEGRPRPDADAIWRRTVRGGAESTPEEVLADALLAASVNGWADVVAWLLDHGADLGARRTWGPFTVTPLHGAGWAGWPEVVTLLLERGADATVRDPTYDTTPLGWAVHCERRDAIDAFLQAGIRE